MIASEAPTDVTAISHEKTHLFTVMFGNEVKVTRVLREFLLSMK